MTTNHKINIIRYILNKVIKQDPINVEPVKEIKEIPRSAWENYIPSSFSRFEYEGMIAPDETLTGLGVLYGGYIDGNNNVRGIITLFNNDFIPVKTIYEYDSGVPLRYIQCMKQADDGTFYLIDDSTFSEGSASSVRTSQKRFVMVNNFTVLDQLTNDYKLTLRTSYVFGSTYSNFYCRDMYKNPSTSSYVFFGIYGTGSFYNAMRIIGLKVNVGESNTWTMYADISNTYFGGGYAIFDESDNVSFKCIGSPYSMSGRNLSYIYKTYTGSTTTTTLHTFNFYPLITYYYHNQCCFINENEVYFVLDNQETSSGSAMNKYIGLYKYNFTDQELLTIYEKSLGSYSTTNQEHIYIDKNQNELYIQYNRNIDTNNNTANYVVQRLENDTWSPPGYDDEENKGFVASRRGLFVKNNFNLLQIYEYPTAPGQSSWFMYLKKINHNPLNYNGSSYTNYNSTIPKQAEIWKNNSILFARNLYNSTINGNQTNSTIVIPNSYLNDIELTKQILYSETNSKIVENTETITKNIYETLYLNFINTINVIDEDTNTKYPISASYINQNINTGTEENCENTFIGKIKVNKGVNTFIINCTWQQYAPIQFRTKFPIVFDEDITSIDFLSNDETTTYYKLDTSSWETGKTYLITQYLRVD
ncbi:MAG: hypothetical protein VZQ62_00940 [Methanosphaera sp.]|nr:hypothetical protein [Methanosphaera sp.]